jgi:succinate dehydrogenase / fumarate reductase flavoprotein subunit
MQLDSKIPSGPIEKHRFDMKLVNPGQQAEIRRHRRRYRPGRRVRRATLAELGYQVEALRLPRLAAPRALDRGPGRHQRGEELPERRRLDPPPVLRHRQGRRLPRARGQRVPPREVSVNIIDQCVAQGVPFAREYGGLLDNRSFGGAQVSRTFYARGQTGQQLLLGAYQALERQIALGNVKMHTACEMLDVVNVDGRARGIVTRDLLTGEFTVARGRRRRARHRRLRQRVLPVDERHGCNVTAAWRAHKPRGGVRQPVLHADPPHLHSRSGDFQSKLTLMSESLRNDGRIWVPKKADETRPPRRSPRTSATTTSSGSTRASATSPARRRVARRQGWSTPAAAWARSGTACTSTSPTRSSGSARRPIRRALRQPVRHVRAHHRREPVRGADAHLSRSHYTMGGLWVDYNLQTTSPACS